MIGLQSDVLVLLKHARGQPFLVIDSSVCSKQSCNHHNYAHQGARSREATVSVVKATTDVTIDSIKKLKQGIQFLVLTDGYDVPQVFSFARILCTGTIIIT